jgi:hypothetical protein
MELVRPTPWIHTLLLVQGVYYLATGIWPIAHMRSFERVSGPKTDRWLVKTLGLILAAIGAALCLSARPRQSLDPELPLVAAGSAAALATADLVYGLTGRISAVYLLEALAELALLAGWRRAWKQ